MRMEAAHDVPRLGHVCYRRMVVFSALPPYLSESRTQKKERQVQTCRAPRRRFLKRRANRVTDLAGIPNFGCIHVQQSHESGHTNHLQVYQYVDLPSSPSTR
jgi:hypothetical protein